MSYIKINNDNLVSEIIIDRSEALNAMNSDMLSELTKAMVKVKSDDKTGVIIITGEGDKAFIAGADIKAMQQMNAKEAFEYGKAGQQLTMMIETSSKPVIAAVNGFALGGGCELALACHMRIVSENASFGQPEVKLGLLAGWGGTQRLGKIVSKGKAMEILTSGKIYSSLESFNMGLVDNIFEEKEFMEKVIDLASTISKNSPQAIHKTIELINKSYEMKYQDGFIVESIEFSKLFQEEESNEGMIAFIEKRKPNWN